MIQGTLGTHLRTPGGPDVDFYEFRLDLGSSWAHFGTMWGDFFVFWDTKVAVWVQVGFLGDLGVEITPEPEAWMCLNPSKY